MRQCENKLRYVSAENNLTTANGEAENTGTASNEEVTVQNGPSTPSTESVNQNGEPQLQEVPLQESIIQNREQQSQETSSHDQNGADSENVGGEQAQETSQESVQNDEPQSQEMEEDQEGADSANINGEQQSQDTSVQEKSAEDELPEKGVGPDVKIDSVEKYQKEKTLGTYR